MKNSIKIVAVSTVLVGSLISGASVFAAESLKTPEVKHSLGVKPIESQAVYGTVATVTGNMLTVNGKTSSKSSAVTTYTVDATGAVVTKNGVTVTISSISVGDTVMIKGTVTGTNVIAKSIRDGLPQNGKVKKEVKKKEVQKTHETKNPEIVGKVVSLNGTTLTLTTLKGNVTYTVDGSNSTVMKGKTSSTFANILVGDTVVVKGAVTGNNVVAKSIIDEVLKVHKK